VNGDWITFVDTVLEDQQGMARYILSIGIPTSAFQSMINDQKLAAHWNPVILDADWTIVARGQHPERFVGKKGAGQEYQDAPDTDRVREVRVLEGIPSMSAHSRSARYRWTSAVAMSKRAIVEDSIVSIAWAAASSLAIVFCAVGLVWLATIRLARGIRSLARTAVTIGAGEPGELAPLPVRELEQVAEGLRRAASEIKHTNSQLEARVAEATLKLTEEMEERSRAENALAQAQRLESLGQLTGGIAHDFNNLLMVVGGFLPRLKAAASSDARAVEAANAIALAVNRGASLTRQLLSFARRQPTNPVAVNLSESLEGLRYLLCSTLGRDVDLKIETAAGTGSARIDANEFELALLNLVLNARDAIKGRGQVTISAKPVTLGAQSGATRLAGDYVAVSVADTGSGMALDTRARAFEPFFTTKEQGRGTGLGLSQVHGFAQQSGGAAIIDSVAGRGTVVTMYLPRADAANPEIASEAPSPTCGGVALLVEDNSEVAAVTKDVLDQLGFEIHVAGDADQALRLVNERQFDIVLSDIILPGSLNGVELARRLRAAHPTLPIVLATGYAGAASDAASEFVVLRKPYGLGELQEAISRVLVRAKNG